MAEKVLTYDEAHSLVQQQCVQCAEAPRTTEQVALGEAAGRVLASAVVADRPHPAFDRSTRDGFAARAADWQRGLPLRVAGLIRAGESSTAPDGVSRLHYGEAVEIMTGAPMPAGADCVVMVEHAVRQGEWVTATPGRAVKPGDNLVTAGAEALAGSVIVPVGARIGFRQIAAAAACGYATVSVFSQPRVAVLATGDELVEVAESPLSHQIRNSNGDSLSAQVAMAGGVARSTIVVDDRAAIDRAITEALKTDLILLSGGVSMGRFDFVEEVLTGRGAEFFFTGVKMQPGRPVVFGRVPSASGWKYFLGLPGNPVSTMVTFALFAGPLLRSLGGEFRATPSFALATLKNDLQTGAGLTRFLPGERSSAHSATAVAPIPWQGSGDLAANARADCYIVVPASSAGLEAGQVVSILLQ